MEKNNNGITLIALVITIIVLLILAGVSIAMLTGDNEILNKATEAKEATETGEIKENIQLNNYDTIMNAYSNGTEVTYLENSEEKGITILNGMLSTDIFRGGPNADSKAKSILKGIIVIPEGVTTISQFSFYECDNITQVVFPSTLTTIGSSVFGSCTNLQSVVLADNITTVGDGAFYNCTSLTNITISRNMKRIETGTFSSCTSLASIIIPSNIEFIDYDVFLRNSTNVSFVSDEARVREICSNSTDIKSYLATSGNISYNQ